jgi:hypothetical protein
MVYFSPASYNQGTLRQQDSPPLTRPSEYGSEGTRRIEDDDDGGFADGDAAHVPIHRPSSSDLIGPNCWPRQIANSRIMQGKAQGLGVIRTGNNGCPGALGNCDISAPSTSPGTKLCTPIRR